MIYRRTLAATAACLALAACSSESAPRTDTAAATIETMSTDGQAAAKTAASMMETKTKAVLVYADWCGSCKVLDPSIKTVQSRGGVPGAEFVTLDYTDKDADAFYAAADAAGVGAAVRRAMDGTIKTGQLLLVDIDDARVIGKVTKSDTPAQIVAKIKDAVAQS